MTKTTHSIVSLSFSPTFVTTYPNSGCAQIDVAGKRAFKGKNGETRLFADTTDSLQSDTTRRAAWPAHITTELLHMAWMGQAVTALISRSLEARPESSPTTTFPAQNMQIATSAPHFCCTVRTKLPPPVSS
jgi:hypothetical protein